MKSNNSSKLVDAIRQLESELVSDVEGTRWKAAVKLGEFVQDFPDDVWPLVLRYGSSNDENLREAVATCILEHLLEEYFDKFFPELEKQIREGNDNLRKTLKLCWKLGQAELPENAAKLDLLATSKSR